MSKLSRRGRQFISKQHGDANAANEQNCQAHGRLQRVLCRAFIVSSSPKREKNKVRRCCYERVMHYEVLVCFVIPANPKRTIPVPL